MHEPHPDLSLLAAADCRARDIGDLGNGALEHTQFQEAHDLPFLAVKA